MDEPKFALSDYWENSPSGGREAHITDYRGRSDLLDTLEDERTFYVCRAPEGVLICEACDNHFAHFLTLDQLEELGNQLVKLAHIRRKEMDTPDEA